MPCFHCSSCLLTQPGFEHDLGSAWSHVQQPCGSGALTHGGEIHDDRDVLVPGAGMPPDMLINAQHFDPVEPVQIINEQALAFGQHCYVDGIPREAQFFGNSGDGRVLADLPSQSPVQGGAADFLSWCCCLAQIFTSRSSAVGTSVAAVIDDQDGGAPAEWVVGESAGHSIAGNAGVTAGAAPLVMVGDFAEDLSF